MWKCVHTMPKSYSKIGLIYRHFELLMWPWSWTQQSNLFTRYCHQTKSGSKRITGSQDTVYFEYMSHSWPWPNKPIFLQDSPTHGIFWLCKPPMTLTEKENVFARQPYSWWCITTASLVAKTFRVPQTCGQDPDTCSWWFQSKFSILIII